MVKPIKYIIENERDALWGLSINTVGYELIEKSEKYPTNKHLPSYYFLRRRAGFYMNIS